MNDDDLNNFQWVFWSFQTLLSNVDKIRRNSVNSAANYDIMIKENLFYPLKSTNQWIVENIL